MSMKGAEIGQSLPGELTTMSQFLTLWELNLRTRPPMMTACVLFQKRSPNIQHLPLLLLRHVGIPTTALLILTMMDAPHMSAMKAGATTTTMPTSSPWKCVAHVVEVALATQTKPIAPVAAVMTVETTAETTEMTQTMAETTEMTQTTAVMTLTTAITLKHAGTTIRAASSLIATVLHTTALGTMTTTKDLVVHMMTGTSMPEDSAAVVRLYKEPLITVDVLVIQLMTQPASAHTHNPQMLSTSATPIKTDK